MTQKTSNYALLFDYENLAYQDLSIIKKKDSEEKVLRETNAESFPVNIPCELSFGLSADGTMTWCKTTSGRDHDCQLIETGKYFQRCFITNLPDLKACNAFYSGLEISSWPDRLSFMLKVTPDKDLKSVSIVYPISENIDSRLDEIAELEEQPLQVSAEQIAPKKKLLKVVYNKDMGWHEIILRTDNIKSDKPAVDPNESNPGPQDDLNNRMERVQFSVTNPSKTDKVLRLNFAKGRLTQDGSSVLEYPSFQPYFVI